MKVFLRFFSVILIIGVLGGSGYLAMEDFFSSKMYHEIDRSSGSSSGTKNPTSDKPFTLLLLGTDVEKMGEGGRTDTIILSVVNPKKGKITLLSIPRDTRVENVHTGQVDKINAAYNNGLGNTVETIEKYLDVPVDYYGLVNFNGFMKLVDLNGGLNINVEEDIAFKDRIKHQEFTLQQGMQKLDGYQSLNYARFRYDAEGDFGRNRRQRQVITALIDQSVQLRNVGKIKDALNILGENAQTNLKFNDIVKLTFELKNIKGDDVKTLPMKGVPEMINGISYVTIPDDEISRVRDELKTLLKGEEVSTLTGQTKEEAN